MELNKRILLKKGASIDNKDNTGLTPFLRASRAGSTKAFRVLLKRGANLHDKEKTGKTALMLAAQYGRIETVKLLLSKGVDINEKDNDGYTALQYAKKERYKDTYTYKQITDLLENAISTKK